jgi:hypothetical protein
MSARNYLTAAQLRCLLAIDTGKPLTDFQPKTIKSLANRDFILPARSNAKAGYLLPSLTYRGLEIVAALKMAAAVELRRDAMKRGGAEAWGVTRTPPPKLAPGWGHKLP